MLLHVVRTTLLLGGLAALGLFLPPGIRDLVALTFCLAAFAHFVGRILKHRHRGAQRAAAVSLTLAFLCLGPSVLIAVRRGLVPGLLLPVVDAGSFFLAACLVIAIMRVEATEDARRAFKRSAALDAEELARVKREAASRKVVSRPTARTTKAGR